jgi:hypothetical protein
MTKRREPAKPDVAKDARKLVQGKQYSGIRGKIVDFADHKFEEGSLFIRVRFTDKTELCWTIQTATVIAEADLCDWETGNQRLLAVFARGEGDWE